MLDFVVIGFQKCGTASVRKYLYEHPEVRVPPDELSPFVVSQPWGERTSPYEYIESIEGQEGHLRGAVDPNYCLCDVAANAESLARRAPGAKLIAFERDPVRRAYSAWADLEGPGWRTFRQAVFDCIARGWRWTQADWLHTSFVAAGLYESILNEFQRVGSEVVRLQMGDTRSLCRELDIEYMGPLPVEHETSYPPGVLDPETALVLEDIYASDALSRLSETVGQGEARWQKHGEVERVRVGTTNAPLASKSPNGSGLTSPFTMS